MNNLTIDRQAVDFYNEFAQQVETFGILNVLDEREDRIFFNKGKKALQAIIDLKKSKRVRYTREEVEVLVDLYLKGTDRRDYVKTFNKIMTHEHSDSSIDQIFTQLRTADNQNPQHTGWVTKSLIAEVASEKAPTRFA